jgi:ATP-dependent DNA helicase RecG
MSTTPEQIDIWRASPSEHQQLEFKEAKTQFDNRKLYKYCVAIANEGGGHMLLGISDVPPRKVVGSAAFNNPVEMAAKLFEAVGFRVDIEEVSHPEGRVVVFHIPGRPLGTAYHFEGAYLMRSGEELVPMSEDRLRGIFAEGQPDWLEEAAATDLTSDDVLRLLDTREFFNLIGLEYPSTVTEVLARLQQDRFIDSHRGEKYSIRRIGALLLAQRMDQFPELARKAPRVVVYHGDSKLQTKLDRVGVKGYAVGFQGLVGFVMAQLPQNEVIKGALRTNVKLVPDVTIRELIANAMVHQDLRLTGMSIMIEVYENRAEISSPGEPVLPVERFIDGYQSRNERLASLMRRLRICEEKSSGIDKVIHAAEFYQLPAPDFRSSQQRTIVTLFGPKAFDDMDREERIRACYQHCALKFVMSERMTNQSLRERFNLPESKAAIVSQVIALAMQADVIKLDQKVGASRKFARYLPFWA